MMNFALLAALAAAGSVQVPQKPPKEIAVDGAICVGWTNVKERVEKQDRFMNGNLAGELGEQNEQRLLDNLVFGDVTVSPMSMCGRPLPLTKKERLKIKYPEDFRRPHTAVTWTTGGMKHIQVMIYLGLDEHGRHRFLLLTRDFVDN